MGNLRDRVSEYKKGFPNKSESCIPMLEADDAFNHVKKLFQQYKRSNPSFIKITIIDPYVIPLDINHLSELFGGSSSIILEIVSKFKESNICTKQESSSDKQESKRLILERKNEVVEQGLFKDINLLHSTLPMHDRYYIFWTENEEKIFSIGGSIAQRFSNYIHINEVTNSYFRKSVLKYYKDLTQRTMDF